MNYCFRHTCPVELKGYPLWQIAIGADETQGEKIGKAKGIIAIGDDATGVIAVGYVSKGIFALGLVAIGVFSIGLISLGAFSIGILAAGIITAKGFAAAALFSAIGKFAVGYHAYGDYYLNIGRVISELSTPSTVQPPVHKL